MKSTNKIFYSIISAKMLAIGLVIITATSQSQVHAQTFFPVANEQITERTTEESRFIGKDYVYDTNE